MNLCKVIIVDDEYLSRRGIRHIIDWEQHGFTIVAEAANAKEALKEIEKHKPNIVLTDIVMPSIDGIELSKIIKTNYPDIEIVIMSGYDDFNYVKKAFQYGVCDYILKPTLDPEKILNVLSPLAEKFLMTSNVQRVTNTSKQIYKTLENLVNNLSYSKELLIKKFKDKFLVILSYQVGHINNSKISSTISEEVRKIYKNCEIINIKNQNNLEFIMISSKSRNIFYNIEELKDLLEKIFPSIYLVSINQYDNFENLEIAINQIIHLLQYKFYSGIDIHYKREDFNVAYKVSEHRKVFDTKIFLEKINHYYFISALEDLKKYIYEIDFKDNINSDELKMVVENSLYNFLNMIDVSSEIKNKLSKNKIVFFNNISSSSNLKELQNSFDEIYSYIFNILSEISNEDQVIDEIIQYIKENYNQQINLMLISQHFHFSYSYVSAYFAQHCNEGFKEYLNKIRIEKAKEFLIKSNESITDISELVGYSEPGYFGKVFKKLVGVTPTEYRRKRGLNEKI